ncbi:NADH-quinone oxidoreductase subunit NuoE family protein [Ilyomonas limi]|nr:NAD(P)H-dependent oxidoreductase subunit E [Ilyomonas limi]
MTIASNDFKQKIEMTFSPDKLNKVQEIIARYPEERQKSALLPVLHLAQEEFGGWLSVEAMDYVASLLQLEPIEVYEVATFYSMYNLKPVGKYVFEVCQTGPCMLRGSDDIIAYIQQKLGINVGETTPDGLFTLKVVECLGACGYAPMMQLGKFYREHLTKEKIDAIIEECIQNAAINN